MNTLKIVTVRTDSVGAVGLNVAELLELLIVL